MAFWRIVFVGDGSGTSQVRADNTGTLQQPKVMDNEDGIGNLQNLLWFWIRKTPSKTNKTKQNCSCSHQSSAVLCSSASQILTWPIRSRWLDEMDSFDWGTNAFSRVSDPLKLGVSTFLHVSIAGGILFSPSTMKATGCLPLSLPAFLFLYYDPGG